MLNLLFEKQKKIKKLVNDFNLTHCQTKLNFNLNSKKLYIPNMISNI